MSEPDHDAEFRSRVASAAAALLLALAVGFFILGRGPGSLVWLNGSTPPWLPFAGSGLTWLAGTPLGWLPFVHEEPRPGPVADASPAPPAAANPTTPPAPPPPPKPAPTHAAPAPSHASPPAPSQPPAPAPTAAPTSTPTPTPPSCPAASYSATFENDPLGYTAAGWTLHTGNDYSTGGWAVAADGSHVLKTTTTPFPVAHAGQTCWTNYTVSALVKVGPDSSEGATPGHARVIARWNKPGYFYACGLDHSGTYSSSPELFLGKEWGGTWYNFSQAAFEFNATTWYRIDFTVSGNNLTCSVTDPGNPSHTVTVTSSQSYFVSGAIGASGEYAEFDNFQVTAAR